MESEERERFAAEIVDSVYGVVEELRQTSKDRHRQYNRLRNHAIIGKFIRMWSRINPGVIDR
jgi:hypothetical protein